MWLSRVNNLAKYKADFWLATLMLKTFLSVSLAVNPKTSTGRLMLHTLYIVLVITKKKESVEGAHYKSAMVLIRSSPGPITVCWVWSNRSQSSTRVTSSNTVQHIWRLRLVSLYLWETRTLRTVSSCPVAGHPLWCFQRNVLFGGGWRCKPKGKTQCSINL